MDAYYLLETLNNSGFVELQPKFLINLDIFCKHHFFSFWLDYLDNLRILSLQLSQLSTIKNDYVW